MAKNEILTGLIKTIKFKSGLTQSEIAAHIGVSKQYLSDTLNGRYPFNDELKQKLYEKFTYLNTDSVQTATKSTKGEMPLIPIEAMAGALTGTDTSFMEYDCEKYVVPIFRGAEFLIRVQGDSMIPKYSSGDIVACQRVPLDRLWFQWGKTYVIDTRQGALIKRIEPSDKEGYVSIHSENEKYKPFDLPIEEINGVALVCGIIRVE